MNLPLYQLREGMGPLVVSVPHAGEYVPDNIAGGLTDTGRAVVDTDWQVDALYAFAVDMGATLITATHSRYVVDLNRGVDGAALYPGKVETTLCPHESFAGEPLYEGGRRPDAAEVARRVPLYWQPYHDEIARQLARVKAIHGRAILFDAHSIARRVPRLFEGDLPALNLGTGDGATLDSSVAQDLLTLADETGLGAVLNGRFKGGYITRHYGRAGSPVQSVQLEMAQDIYLQDGGTRLDTKKADQLVPQLARLLDRLIAS